MTSFTLYDPHPFFTGLAEYFTSQIRSHIEYVMPTDDIVLVCHFNLT